MTLDPYLQHNVCHGGLAAGLYALRLPVTGQVSPVIIVNFNAISLKKEMFNPFNIVTLYKSKSFSLMCLYSKGDTPPEDLEVGLHKPWSLFSHSTGLLDG